MQAHQLLCCSVQVSSVAQQVALLVPQDFVVDLLRCPVASVQVLVLQVATVHCQGCLR